jgi:hypothetical protein
VNALVKAGLQHAFGRDHVDAFEAGEPCQQIEVDGREAVRIGDPVADGDDDVCQRSCGSRRKEMRAEPMLVDRIDRLEPPFVGTKRRGQKPGLLEQTYCAAIVVSLEARGEQFLESLDRLPLATKLVVEPQHLGDQARPDVERRRLSFGDGVGRG